MKSRTAVTVIVPTFNESMHMEELLTGVQWADEIIVVDSFSTDDTIEIAKQHSAKVLQRVYTGPADQKNWAIPQAKHSWVLLLDADERVGEELAAEIQEIVQVDPPIDAYWIGRDNEFMGKRVRYSGWQNDRVVRLIRRDRCRYHEVQVHEEINLEGLRVGQLNARLYHYTFRDLDHYLDKMRRYARWSAKDHLARTSQVGYYHLLLKPLFRFFKHFVIQRGFMDGYVGFIISAIMAWGVFLRYVYLRKGVRSEE